MTQAKHTQGPWVLGDKRRHGHLTVRSTRGGYPAGGICEVFDPMRGREIDANAHLIAAAPDLLAACEALVQSVAYAIDALDAPANSTMRANLADALAAIAKAKGEA